MTEPTAEFDVVVAGSGVGGLAAAVTAGEAGRSVLVLEKGPYPGGSSGLSGAQLWMPANAYAADRVDDSVESGVNYLAALAGDFYVDSAAARHYVESAREAVAFFEDRIDLDLQVIWGMPDYHLDVPGGKREGRYLEPQPLPRDEYPQELPNSPHLPGGATTDELVEWGGAFTAADWDWDVIDRRREEGVATMGTALIGYFLRAAMDMDVEIRTGVGATDLTVDDDSVVVDVEAEDTTEAVRATDGFVIATGSYDWNPKLVESFEGTPSELVASAAVPTATGDGITMAASNGAKLGIYPPTSNAKGFFVAVPDDEFLGAPLYRYCYNVGLPHAIAVNADGERFCDEAFYPKQVDAFYDDEGDYDQFPAYMVFDEQYRRRYPLANYMPGTDYPDSFLAGRADDIAGLAAEIDIDPNTLESTIETFNDYARAGEDPEFDRGDNVWANIWCGDPANKPNPNLGPLEEPPFYAVELYIGLSSMSNVGLLTDEDGRVLDWDDSPIDGVYATGSVCAPQEWGTGYQSGLQNGRSLTYGYLAGRHIVRSSA
ncbi:FAD-dependent oxidoreductase [Natrialbaceae archaeon GCM10025810]|uniref:FAD-dependent oxidoreductase n=1 Tax=Halovalidus salilacus TaxID=3075124 RepID=UPI003614E820